MYDRDTDVVTEKVLQCQEITALLASNATLKRLYDLALTMDYRFDNQVTEYTFSDGKSLLLMMMICPEPFGPVYITVTDDGGYIQAVDEMRHDPVQRERGIQRGRRGQHHQCLGGPGPRATVPRNINASRFAFSMKSRIGPTHFGTSIKEINAWPAISAGKAYTGKRNVGFPVVRALRRVLCRCSQVQKKFEIRQIHFSMH
jgi:hypothetical protein